MLYFAANTGTKIINMVYFAAISDKFNAFCCDFDVKSCKLVNIAAKCNTFCCKFKAFCCDFDALSCDFMTISFKKTMIIPD